MVLRHLNKDATEWYPNLWPAPTLLSSTALVWLPRAARAASAGAALMAMGAATSARVTSVAATGVAAVLRRRAVTLLELQRSHVSVLLPTLTTPSAQPCPPPRPRQILGGGHLEWSAGIAFGPPLPGSSEEDFDDDIVMHRDPREDKLDEDLPKCSVQLGKSTASFAGSERKVPPTGRPPDVIRRPP